MNLPRKFSERDFYFNLLYNLQKGDIVLSNKEDFIKEFIKCTRNEGHIDLPQEILHQRPEFLFVVDELTHHKLTVSELNQSYLILAGLLLGKYPKIAAVVSSEDRIRLPYAVLEQLTITKGKLTLQEKLLFAFCAFHSVCVEFYDEKAGKIRKGISDITSTSYVIKLLEWEMERHPEKFKFLSSFKEDSGKEYNVKVYIDPYATENSIEAPERLILADSENPILDNSHRIDP